MTSSGPSRGWPRPSVRITPASSAISSVAQSYGWQHRPCGLVLDAVEQRAEVGVEAVVADDQLVELPAGGDVLVVEDGGAGDVGRADRGRATRCSISSLASTFVPGKKLADRSRSRDRSSAAATGADGKRMRPAPFGRSTRSPVCPSPFDRPQHVGRSPILLVGSSVITATSMSRRRVAGAPVRRDAGQRPARAACRT